MSSMGPSEQSLLEVITEELKVGITDLYKTQLEELLLFSETMHEINYPGAQDFKNMIVSKLDTISNFTPDSERIKDLSSKYDRTKDIIEQQAILNEIRNEIHSEYVIFCSEICSNIPSSYKEQFIDTLENPRLFEQLNPQLYLYLQAVNTQMGYFSSFGMAMSYMPMVENIIKQALPPGTPRPKQQLSPGNKKQSLLYSTASTGLSTAASLGAGLYSYMPSMVHNQVDRSTKATKELIKGYIPEIVHEFGATNIDDMLLANCEFSRKNKFWSSLIKNIYEDLDLSFNPEILKPKEQPDSNEMKLVSAGFDVISRSLQIAEKGLTEDMTSGLLQSAATFLSSGANLSQSKSFNLDEMNSYLQKQMKIFGQTHYSGLAESLVPLMEILSDERLMNELNDPAMAQIHYVDMVVSLSEKILSKIEEDSTEKQVFDDTTMNDIRESLGAAIKKWCQVQRDVQINKTIETPKETESLDSLDVDIKTAQDKIIKLAKKPKIQAIAKKKLERLLAQKESLIKKINAEGEESDGGLVKRSISPELKQTADEVLELCRTGFWRAAFSSQNLDDIDAEKYRVLTELVISNMNWTLYPKYLINGLKTLSSEKGIIMEYSELANYMYGMHVLDKVDKKFESLEKINTFDVSKEIQECMEELLEPQESSEELGQGEEQVTNISTRLYLHSAGGGGHTAAMKAKVAEDREEAQKTKVNLPEDYSPLTIDLMNDWLGLIGDWSTQEWNEAQKRGDIEKQEALIAQQHLGNLAFGNIAYKHLYALLKDNANINEIVNTQALCTPSICQAVLDINRKLGRNVKIRLVMTDLPTDKATHFWSGLKNLTDLQRSVISLETVKPIIGSAEQFIPNVGPLSTNIKSSHSDDINVDRYFRGKCGKGLSIKITEPPIRPEFKQKNHRDRNIINGNQLNFKFSNETEKRIFESKGCQIKEKTAGITVQESDYVGSIMLGSQGGKAISDYVDNIIKNHTSLPGKSKTIICVYCGAAKGSISSELYLDVCKKANGADIPEDLVILPLGMQDGLSIAENYARNDFTVIRSGGLASFEALESAKENPSNKFFIHSEGKGNQLDELKRNIAVWEGGNAEYLEDKIGATIVNPELFTEHYTELQNTSKVMAKKP